MDSLVPIYFDIKTSGMLSLWATSSTAHNTSVETIDGRNLSTKVVKGKVQYTLDTYRCTSQAQPRVQVDRLLPRHAVLRHMSGTERNSYADWLSN